MARVKEKDQTSNAEDVWAYYDSIQLSPEQKTAAKADLQRQIDDAAASGVYEELLELQGKVVWPDNITELREDRD